MLPMYNEAKSQPCRMGHPCKPSYRPVTALKPFMPLTNRVTEQAGLSHPLLESHDQAEEEKKQAVLN